MVYIIDGLFFYLADPTLARHLLATVWVAGSFEFCFPGHRIYRYRYRDSQKFINY